MPQIVTLHLFSSRFPAENFQSANHISETVRDQQALSLLPIESTAAAFFWPTLLLSPEAPDVPQARW
jgi:hypothetical protein